MANIAGTNALVVAAAAPTGGIIDGGKLDAANLKQIIVGDDYPARAIREELEGLVEGEIIVSPEGRVIDVTIDRSFAPYFNDLIRKTMARRLRAHNLPQHGEHFIRFRLPTIQFRMPRCEQSAPVTPAVEGALVVDAPPYCRRAQR